MYAIQCPDLEITLARPNILLITTDQQRFDHIGLKGVGGIDTPNLDRLGTEGVHFDRAYTCGPTCTPARVSLLTGRYPSSHGAYTIGVSLTEPGEIIRPTIPDLLVQNGYSTACFGKTHFVRRVDEASHVAGRPDPTPEFWHEFTGPYMGFEYVQVTIGHTIHNVPSMHYRAFLEKAGVDYKPWFPAMSPGYDHWRVGPWEIPEEFHDTSWVSGLTRQYIRDNAKSEKPWFCWASFQDPHEPYVCPTRWFDKVRADEIKPFTPALPGEFDDRPEFYRKGAAVNLTPGWADLDDGFGVPCSFSMESFDQRAKTALQATLGSVAFLDDRLGTILKELEATGQADNTVIVFTTDHGEMHGHHGFWGKGLTAYDDCQRVPLLIWGPGIVKPVGTTQAIANLVDLPRTMLACAGVTEPLGIQGADLTPVLTGQADSVQDHTFIEARATAATIYQTTMITDQYKLVVYRDSDEGELYDMHADPDQYTNLWNKPEFQSIKADLLLKYARGTMAKEGRVKPRVSFA